MCGWPACRVHVGAVNGGRCQGGVGECFEGPKEIAKAFDVKETVMTRRGIGYVAADGSHVNNYGETKIVG